MHDNGRCRMVIRSGHGLPRGQNESGLMGATSIGFVAFTQEGTTMSSTATDTAVDTDAPVKVKPSFLVMDVAGVQYPLLQTQVKPREGDTEIHTYYCFREPTRASGAFGVKVQPSAEHLPTQVTIDGVVVFLERGLTADRYKEKRNGQTVEVLVPQEKRRARVASKTFQTFPRLADESGDTGIRNVDVSISETTDGLWNVKVVVNRSGLTSVSPEKKAENAKKAAADRSAAFAAILAGLQD